MQYVNVARLQDTGNNCGVTGRTVCILSVFKPALAEWFRSLIATEKGVSICPLMGVIARTMHQGAKQY